MGNTTPRLAHLVKSARADLGITQDDMAKLIGKSRFWVISLEKGAMDERRFFSVTPDEIVKISLALKIPPVKLLEAGEVPPKLWPDLSHMRSKDVNIRGIDLTALTPRQAQLIEALVEELKNGNGPTHDEDTSPHPAD